MYLNRHDLNRLDTQKGASERILIRWKEEIFPIQLIIPPPPIHIQELVSPVPENDLINGAHNMLVVPGVIDENFESGGHEQNIVTLIEEA